jgi:hypothetical protein
MSNIIKYRWASLGSAQSRIQFATDGGGAWPVWDRYLLLDGKRAYQIGNICNTCAFFFERMDGANDRVEVNEAAAALQDGLQALSDPVSDQIAAGMPKDDYLVLLAKLAPRLVRPNQANDYFCHEQITLWGLDGFWGLPHNPRVPYYRGGDRDLEPGTRLFQFVIPMFPDNWLDQNSIHRYTEVLSSGRTPTAVAISVLDVKAPADPSGDIKEHYCLAHFLLDGHHKLLAAAKSGCTVSLLAFVSCSNGTSSREELARVLP